MRVIAFLFLFSVLIKPLKGSPQYKATLVYSTSGTFQAPYDIAVLKCPAAVNDYQNFREPRICSPKLGWSPQCF